MNFDNRFPNKSRGKKFPERDPKMPTGNPSKVEKRVRDRSAEQDCHETVFLETVVYDHFGTLHKGFVGLCFQVVDLVDLFGCLEEFLALLLGLCGFFLGL